MGDAFAHAGRSSVSSNAIGQPRSSLTQHDGLDELRAKERRAGRLDCRVDVRLRLGQQVLAALEDGRRLGAVGNLRIGGAGLSLGDRPREGLLDLGRGLDVEGAGDRDRPAAGQQGDRALVRPADVQPGCTPRPIRWGTRPSRDGAWGGWIEPGMIEPGIGIPAPGSAISEGAGRPLASRLNEGRRRLMSDQTLGLGGEQRNCG